MSVNLDTKYSAVSTSGEAGEFTLGELFSFSDKTLLFFYPKDNTPGCTVENKDFSCMVSEYKKLGITLVGVSKDSVESHQKFISSQELNIDLISDPELTLHKQLGAYGEKNNYGKIVTGVIRSTFLFDKQGNILQEWKNVRAKGHAAKVYREIEK
ncbi:peroxiredoxin [Candidatus Gracilibacteria bacterium]|nr:peroxiredoxin [Candidatus Gracilibacteria bacterium]